MGGYTLHLVQGKLRLLRLVLALAVVVALALGSVTVCAAQGVGLAARLHFDGSPGTSAPPATLGGYAMTAFPNDARTLGQTVTSVNGPTGAVAFNPALSHFKIGAGWGSWSHGYTGDVYATTGTQVVITLPPNTVAFYFYAEPNLFDVFTVTATAQDGTSSGPVNVNGAGGAKYFGFYGTDGALISKITVTVPAAADGFALGEFGINSQALLGPSEGVTGVPYTFTGYVGATSSPGSITYAWTATGQAPVTHTTTAVTDSVAFTWGTGGTKTVTLVASIQGSQLVNASRSIVISAPPPDIPEPSSMLLLASGLIGLGGLGVLRGRFRR